MLRDELDEAFAFVNGADQEPAPLRDKADARPANWRAWVVAAVAFSFHGALLAGFLNFMGIVRVPRLEWFTRDRLMAAPAVPAAPGPVAASNRPPAKVAAVPALRTRAQPVARGDRPQSPAGPPAPAAVAVASVPPRRSLQEQRSTAGADQTASGAANSPSDAAAALLQSKGIIRGASGFLLESEATVRAKLVELRAKAGEFNSAYDRLAAIRLSMAQLQEVNQQLIATDASIAELKFQMSQFRTSTIRGVVYHGSTTDENAAYDGLKATVANQQRYRGTTLIPQRDTLRQRQPGRDEEGRAVDRLKLREDAGAIALAELRAAVVATQQGYDSLANDYEVKNTLAKLGAARFGPSEEFLANVRELGVFEKSLGLKPTVPEPKSFARRR